MFERQGYIVVSSRIRRKKGDVLPFLGNYIHDYLERY